MEVRKGHSELLVLSLPLYSVTEHLIEELWKSSKRTSIVIGHLNV